MFRQFAAALNLPNAPNIFFDAHPSELAALLEDAWQYRLNVLGGLQPPPLGEPQHRSDLGPTNPAAPLGAQLIGTHWPPITALRQRILIALRNAGNVIGSGILWDHLIYAYMIENTRVYEIFKRAVEQFVHGEQLGAPRPEAQAWLRNTEELFFKDGAPFYIGSINSHIRPDLRANRRNPYHRMFGMDLNHGTDDGKQYPYVKAVAANNDFVNTFEEFLREVWVGMIYVQATAAANPTDQAKITTLVGKLKDMLLSRRQSGNLSREEFAAVSAMAWFHLTLEFTDAAGLPAPIVQSLRAEASGTEQRLFKIAERVGLPAHGLSKHYFDIADQLSRILIEIEMGVYDPPGAVAALFRPGPPGAPEEAMRIIITHWTAITGRDVKARKVAAS
jgi:transcriptional regulator with XRE-family HTH domain